MLDARAYCSYMKQQQVQKPRPRRPREVEDKRSVKQTPAQDATWKRGV